MPLDGAVAGLKATLALPSADFALLHDALFSMSWHASLRPSWQVLLPRAASWHSWCAESLRPDGSGGFLSRGGLSLSERLEVVAALAASPTRAARQALTRLVREGEGEVGAAARGELDRRA